MGVLLRIIAGPNAGAEAPLPTGTHLLGKGDDCDFILADPSVAAAHVRLAVSKNGEVMVLPTNRRVRLGGKPIESDSPLPPYAVLTIGNTNLAIGPDDAEWPKIYLPGANNISIVPPEIAAAAHAIGVQPVPDSHEEEGGVKKRPRSLALPTLAGLLIMIGMGALCAYAMGVWDTPPSELERLHAMLSNNGWSVADSTKEATEPAEEAHLRQTLTVSKTETGFLIKGVVSTPRHADRLKKLLASVKLPLPVKVEVETAAALRAKLNAKLEEIGPGFTIESYGLTGAQIKGYAIDAAHAEAMKEKLQELLKPFPGSRINIITWDDIKPVLMPMTRERGLTQVQFQPQPEGISVTGARLPEEAVTLGRLRMELADQTGVNIPIFRKQEPAKAIKTEKDIAHAADSQQEAGQTDSNDTHQEAKVESAAPKASQPKPTGQQEVQDIQILAVDVGKATNRFQDGQKQWREEGTHLPNGYLVKEVFSTGAVLTKSENTFIITIASQEKVTP